jgi:hypothetical protein
VCVGVYVVLGIKNAMRVRHIFIVGYPALQYFSHYLINDKIFGGKDAIGQIIFMKIPPVRAELFHVEQTDRQIR